MDPVRRDELLRTAVATAERFAVLAVLGLAGFLAIRVARRGLGILWKQAQAASRYAGMDATRRR